MVVAVYMTLQYSECGIINYHVFESMYFASGCLHEFPIFVCDQCCSHA